MVSPTVRVLLSGGIGSGKSAVSEALRAKGIAIFDSDKAGHEALEPDGEAFEQVSKRWPEIVEDGRINRRALGRIVFGNPELLAELESYTHPAIRTRLDRQVDALDADIAMVEMPLPKDFMGPGWLRAVVDVPDAIRIDRLLARGMQREEILQRMAAQPSRNEWKAIAHYVLDNSGSLDELDAEIDALIAWMRRLVRREETA